MEKLNYTKLKAAIHEAESYLKGKQPFPTAPAFPSDLSSKPYAQHTSEDKARMAAWQKGIHMQYRSFWEKRATLLYSLTAHSRGKLHIKKQRKYEHDPKSIVERTMADQEKLITELHMPGTMSQGADRPQKSIKDEFLAPPEQIAATG